MSDALNIYGGGDLLVEWLVISGYFLTEISASSLQQLFIFIIYKKHFLDQSIQKTFYFMLKTKALLPTPIALRHGTAVSKSSKRSVARPVVLFSRHICQVTLKNIYFHYLKKLFWTKVSKNFLFFIFEN